MIVQFGTVVDIGARSFGASSTKVAGMIIRRSGHTYMNKLKSKTTGEEISDVAAPKLKRCVGTVRTKVTESSEAKDTPPSETARGFGSTSRPAMNWRRRRWIWENGSRRADHDAVPFSAKREGGRRPDGVWKAGRGRKGFAVTVVQAGLGRSGWPHPIRRYAPPSPASWGRVRSLRTAAVRRQRSDRRRGHAGDRLRGAHST